MQLILLIIQKGQKSGHYSSNKMEDTSRTVFTVLENLGFTSDFRKSCVENAEAFDMVYILLRSLQVSNLLVNDNICRSAGSRVDGTYRQSLNSDMDCLLINRTLTVGDIGDNGVFYHMIYMDKYPGYALLRANVNNKTSSEESIFKTVTDSMGHVFLTNELTPNNLVEKLDKSGPAVKYAKSTLTENENDIVFAYQCMTWPQIADEWLIRERRHSWPSIETIEKFRMMTCLLVPAAHPHCTRVSIEDPDCTKNRHHHWRLSFSLQERHLMVNLTDVQYKCYVLLKMIKEGIITPKLGKSLTSYHCKTSLFYTIEENDQSLWRTENLLECVRKCLQRLLNWAERRFCPNYFLPSSNLFLGKVEGDKLDKLVSILEELVRRLPENIVKLKIENVPEWIQSINTNDIHKRQRLMDEANTSLTDTLMNLLNPTLTAESILYGILSMGFCTQGSIEHFNLLRQGPHSGNDECLNIVTGCLNATMASVLMSKALHTTLPERDWYIGAAVSNFIRALALEDKIGRLKLANVLIATGHRHSAGKILHEIEKDIMSVCVLTDLLRVEIVREAFPVKDGIRDILHFPVSELLKRFTCGPVLFGPAELAVIPNALVFEMFRTVATPHALQKWCSQYLITCHYNYVMIDAVNMFHLLKYHAGVYNDFIEFLCCIITSGIIIQHEIVCNMVSWEARKAGFYGLSALMCRKSWIVHCLKMKKLAVSLKIPDRLCECNAAKLHMAVLVYELWKDKVKMEQAKTQIEHFPIPISVPR